MAVARATQLPFDAALQLDDGATAHAAGATFGTVGGANFVFDIMAGAPGLGSPPSPDTIRYGGTCVVDVLAITGTDVVTIEGSVDAAFTNPITLATTPPLTAAGPAHMPFANLGGSAGLLRYLRAKHTVTGGPATVIVFLAPLDNLGYS